MATTLSPGGRHYTLESVVRALEFHIGPEGKHWHWGAPEEPHLARHGFRITEPGQDEVWLTNLREAAIYCAGAAARNRLHPPPAPPVIDGKAIGTQVLAVAHRALVETGRYDSTKEADRVAIERDGLALSTAVLVAVVREVNG